MEDWGLILFLLAVFVWPLAIPLLFLPSYLRQRRKG